MRIFHYPSSSILLMALLNLARYYPYTLFVSVSLEMLPYMGLTHFAKDFHRFREILHRDFSPMHSME